MAKVKPKQSSERKDPPKTDPPKKEKAGQSAKSKAPQAETENLQGASKKQKPKKNLNTKPPEPKPGGGSTASGAAGTSQAAAPKSNATTTPPEPTSGAGSTAPGAAGTSSAATGTSQAVTPKTSATTAQPPAGTTASPTGNPGDFPLIENHKNPTPDWPHVKGGTKEELAQNAPFISQEVLDWGFSQAGKDGQPVQQVDESRAQEMWTLQEIMNRNKFSLDTAKGIYEGHKGGRIAGLVARGLDYGQVVDFTGELKNSKGDGFLLDVMDRFINNTKSLKKERFMNLWQQGVNAFNLALMADKEDGGLLRNLHDRKLGDQNIVELINRVKGANDKLTIMDTTQLDFFNDAAARKSRDWATNLIREKDLTVNMMTEALRNPVLDEIVNKRKIGDDFVGTLTNWATRQAREKYGDNAFPEKQMNEFFTLFNDKVQERGLRAAFMREQLENDPDTFLASLLG